MAWPLFFSFARQYSGYRLLVTGYNQFLLLLKHLGKFAQDTAHLPDIKVLHDLPHYVLHFSECSAFTRFYALGIGLGAVKNLNHQG